MSAVREIFELSELIRQRNVAELEDKLIELVRTQNGHKLTDEQESARRELSSQRGHFHRTE